MYSQATYGGCEVIIPGLHRGTPPSTDHLHQYFDVVVYCTNPEFDLFLADSTPDVPLREYKFHLDEIERSPELLARKVTDVTKIILEGGRAAVLCTSGINRSGVFCVLALIRLGYSVQESLNILAASYRGSPRGDVQSLIQPVVPYLVRNQE